MDGERERGAEEAEGEENESARRLRAREPLFLDLAHFSMPVDSYPNLPSLSFSFSRSSSISSIFHLFGSSTFLRVPRAPPPPPIRSPPSAAALTSFFHYVYTIAKNDDISAFSRSSAFQKTVRAKVRPASAGSWINADEFTMQNERFYAAATLSNNTVAYKIFIKFLVLHNFRYYIYLSEDTKLLY